MRASVPVSFILIPSLCAFGLLLYGIFSDKWVRVNYRRVEEIYDSDIPRGLVKSYERRVFLKRFGLFRKCLEYKWLNVIQINSSTVTRPCSTNCQPDEFLCGRCCIKSKLRCNDIPECETYDDEINCPRLYEDNTWLDKSRHCFYQRINVLKVEKPKNKLNRTANYIYLNDILHCIQVWALISSALLILLIFISFSFIRLCWKHLGFPFTLITVLSTLSFLCSLTGIGVFLWQWVHKKINAKHFAVSHENALVYRLNPWLSDIEELGVAFYISCGAALALLMTTILSFCFCCGVTATSHVTVKNEKGSYEIVQMLPYEDHYTKS